MSLSNYAENVVLDLLMAMVASVGLSTADPGEDGSGLAEPSGMGYSRRAVTAADWNAAASGSVTNANKIEFLQATNNWGTLTHLVLFDSSGNMLGSNALDLPAIVVGGDYPKFEAGELTINAD